MSGRKPRLPLWALALWAASLAAPALAQTTSGEQIAHAGNANGALACIACHGPQGEGNALLQPPAPRLAGLSADYIAKQLGDLRTGKRVSLTMAPIAQGLSADEAKAVAGYFSTLSPPSAPGTAEPPAALAAGERLATLGHWDAGVPACASCHAPLGVGVAPGFPYLAGQSAAYIKTQLLAWKTGQRSNDPLGLMQAIAAKLDEAQVDAVARYYQSLPSPVQQGKP